MNKTEQFTTDYVVRFDDVDAAGIVYYPRYFNLCHMAFEDVVNFHGPCSYAHLINDRRLGFPTVHVDATFAKPLLYGNTISISGAVREINNASMKIDYEFFERETMERCFFARVTTVCVDLSTKKSKAVPPDLRTFFANYLIVT